MNKFLTVVVVAGAMVSGCVKKRTCECTITNKLDNATSKTVYTVTTTKKQIKQDCKNYEADSYYENVSCEIKK
jgi:hypothetical protein